MKKSLLNTAVATAALFSSLHADIKFGVIPLEDKKIMEKKFTPLCEYMGLRTNQNCTLVIGKDYKEIEDAIAAGTIDYAYVGPLGYVKVVKKNPKVKPLVIIKKKGKATYKSCIVARKDNTAIDSVKDIKDKRFAFGDSGSTSSYLIPKLMLQEDGVKLADLAGFNYTGSHSNVARAVIEGTADAGGCKESVALKNADKLKIVKLSKDIPGFPIIVNTQTVKRKDYRRLQRALVLVKAYDPVVKSIGAKHDGFFMAFPWHYDIIKDAMDK